MEENEDNEDSVWVTVTVVILWILVVTNCVTAISVATRVRKRLNREGIGSLLMLRILVNSFALANGALILQVHLFV